MSCSATNGPPGHETDDRWDWYGNMTGHPAITFPRKFETQDGFPNAKAANDDRTRLRREHHARARPRLPAGHWTCAGRPPLDQFLPQKDEILAGEEFPDENKYYTD